MIALCLSVQLLSKSLHAQSNTFPGSGDVGIGTTSPTAPLSILSPSSDTGLKIGASGKSTEIKLHVAGGEYGFLNLDGNTIFRGGDNPSYFNGKLGIGTANPTTKLHVVNSGTNDGEFRFGQIGGDDEAFFRMSNGNNWGFLGRSDVNDPKIGAYFNGSLQIWPFSNSGGTLHTGKGALASFDFGTMKVGIGTDSPTSKLTVNGTAKAKEIIVEENIGADFVFEEDYSLPSLSEVEQHIKTNKHLPEIPSAEEMITDGVKVGELQMKLLQKIEELTLYVIELEKRHQKKEERFTKQQVELERMKKKLLHVASEINGVNKNN